MTLFETLAVPDIQQAADALQGVYEKTKKLDGYVSLEVSPYQARNTEATLSDARRLWSDVKRPNLMIKIPGTPEGIPAFEQAISEGINVNVTLLFSNDAYEKVALAYISGLEKRQGDLSGIASVASFFISRIDAAVDALLQKEIDNMADTGEQQLAKSLLGKVAIANGKLAYKRFKELFSGERWEKLKARGAQPQRLLWASTSTKNPEYRDVMYVEELIGPLTVDTLPPATFDAFRDHGKLRNSLEENVDAAAATMANLKKANIDINTVTDKLLVDGLKLFSEAFDKLLNALDARCKPGAKPKTENQTYKLEADAEKKVKASLAEWQTTGLVRRMWAGDAKVWTGDDEGKWLGWLTVTDDQLAHMNNLDEVVVQVKDGGFTHAVLLGMGGSSLCVEVLEKTFGSAPGFPKFHVLDSTDPAQVKAIEDSVDLAKTLFIVSSKSGSTLEPNIFKQYFFERMAQTVGAGKAGRHFFAITDPGSKMEQVAKADSFRCVFHGLPSIGGRYSALSNFGMVPAAAMGLDIRKLLDKTEEMVQSCTSCVTTDHNPGVILGTILGTLANAGRDKVTIITSPAVADLGAWLEQLMAESTGKEGHGLIPVDREPIGNPSVYGKDRVFIYVRFKPEPDMEQDLAVNALAQSGQPVVTITMEDKYDLGQEFFRWEIATAVAGSLIGINAFNQPDVEASKNATRSLTTEYEKNGSLPPENPIFEAAGIKLYTDEANASQLGKKNSIGEYIKAHLDRVKDGDYFALLAYVQMNSLHDKQLQSIRTAVRDHKKAATCLGFGPRFLHSTGQAYKGGPNSGVFLQVTCDDAHDIPVPGQKYTFGTVKAAQARGDLAVLEDRKRRALRVHLGSDVHAGLAVLEAAVREALV